MWQITIFPLTELSTCIGAGNMQNVTYWLYSAILQCRVLFWMCACDPGDDDLYIQGLCGYFMGLIVSLWKLPKKCKISCYV